MLSEYLRRIRYLRKCLIDIEKMKVDHTVSHLSPLRGIKRIIKESSETLEPIIIIRGDDPKVESRIRGYLNEHYHCYLVTLGVTCPPSYAYFDLALQLDKSFKLPNDAYDYDTISLICRSLKKLKKTSLVVIDNFHLYSTIDLFKLAKMIRYLEGISLFLFFIPNNYHLEKWKSKLKEEEPYLKFFLTLVRKIYVIRG